MADGLIVPPPRSTTGPGGGPLDLADRLPRPVCFVMAGGGAHGAVQWGALQALSETDIVPDMIVGTSVGALGGAVLAEDPGSAVNRLAYVWAQLDMSDLLGGNWLGRKWLSTALQRSLVGSGPEREALEAMLRARDFADLAIPFAAVTTDLASGEAAVHDSGDLIDALLASSAIPGMLPPVVIEGRPQMDGLASANLPAAAAVARGARSLVVLDTGSRPTPDAEEVLSSQARLIGRTFAVMSAQQRRTQVHAAARQAVVLLVPTPTDLGGTLDFRDTMGVAARSYAMARDFLADLTAGNGPFELGLHARRSDPVAAKLGDVSLWPVGP